MSVRFKLEGIYTPVITPFHADSEIDFDALAELVERLVGAGVHGLISGGSTGENYAETIEERLTIARFIGDRVKGRIPVVIGTGAMRTPDSIALATGAREMGADILSVRQVRKLGTEGVLARIPAGARVYVTIDIDGFCPSIAPGTGTPSHGGFLYYEVLEILQGLARAHDIVGVDLVEVAPDYDHSQSTAILAAQVLLNFLGFIFHARSTRQDE